jgi:hypothetical protein
MADSGRIPRPGVPATPELDELQRGQERPLTVETLEGAAPTGYRRTREVPVPDPGERPGALRAGSAPPGETEEPEGESG